MVEFRRYGCHTHLQHVKELADEGLVQLLLLSISVLLVEEPLQGRAKLERDACQGASICPSCIILAKVAANIEPGAPNTQVSAKHTCVRLQLPKITLTRTREPHPPRHAPPLSTQVCLRQALCLAFVLLVHPRCAAARHLVAV